MQFSIDFRVSEEQLHAVGIFCLLASAIACSDLTYQILLTGLEDVPSILLWSQEFWCLSAYFTRFQPLGAKSLLKNAVSCSKWVRSLVSCARVKVYFSRNSLFSQNPRDDGRRPDGVSLTPWKCGCILVWDITCPDTFAPSHVLLPADGAGIVVNEAEYDIDRVNFFHSTCHRVLRVFWRWGMNFLRELGRRIFAALGSQGLSTLWCIGFSGGAEGELCISLWYSFFCVLWMCVCVCVNGCFCLGFCLSLLSTTVFHSLILLHH